MNIEISTKSLEAAAKALYESFTTREKGRPDWHGIPEFGRRAAREDARAAINAFLLVSKEDL